MEESGNSNPCPSMKTLTDKVGRFLCGCSYKNKYKRLDAKLERKMIELRQGTSEIKSFRSINSIIMKFPQLREEIKNLKDLFEQYDEDCNGYIDRKELKKCLKELKVNITDEEFDDLFYSCDIDRNEQIQFKEFIVLLCLVYLLTKSSSSFDTVSRMGSEQLEVTFDLILQAFFCLDKNCDGKLNKKDMVMALTETPWEKSPAHITKTRFMEMDRDKDGNVSFREFLFALTSWLDIECDEEIPITGD